MSLVFYHASKKRRIFYNRVCYTQKLTFCNKIFLELIIIVAMILDNNDNEI